MTLGSQTATTETPVSASAAATKRKESVEKVPETSFESVNPESVSEIESTTPLEMGPTPEERMSRIEGGNVYSDELIDMLIEQETALLVASGSLCLDDDEEDSEEEAEENAAATAAAATHTGKTYLSTASAAAATDSGDENHASERSDRSPQRKVAFKLNSEEDELVYPGQTDSEECTSSSEEQLVENGVLAAGAAATVKPGEANDEDLETDPEEDEEEEEEEEESNHVEEVASSRPVAEGKVVVATEVERKFERMASQETVEDGGKAEGEFQRIVSQLSFEEVTECLNAWNETESNGGCEIKEKTPPSVVHIEGIF